MDPLNKCTEQNQEISPAPVFDLNSNLLKKGTAVLAVPSFILQAKLRKHTNFA